MEQKSHIKEAGDIAEAIIFQFTEQEQNEMLRYIKTRVRHAREVKITEAREHLSRLINSMVELDKNVND